MNTVVPDLNYAAPVLRVADLQRALAYYRDQLGFGVEFVHESFYAGVIRDGCRIHLKCAASGERRPSHLDAEVLDACLGVRDAQALASALETSGATFSVPLRAMPYGKEFCIRDPDGNILGFVESTDA